jgi:putative membrane protein
VSNTEIKAHQNPSRVRDHLANERTYLAWMRTAVALMGFGVVIVRLRYLIPPQIPRTGQGWKLGLLFALVALLTVLFSTIYYFAIRRAIDNDTYEPASWWVILFSFSVALIGSGILYLLLTSPVNIVTAAPPGLFDSLTGKE